MNRRKMLKALNRDIVQNSDAGRHRICLSEQNFMRRGHTDFSTLFLLDPTEDSGLLAASVISAGQLSIAELASYCKQHLGVLAAEKFFLVDDFPRNLGGKVMRNEVCSHAKNMRDTSP